MRRTLLTAGLLFLLGLFLGLFLHSWFPKAQMTPVPQTTDVGTSTSNTIPTTGTLPATDLLPGTPSPESNSDAVDQRKELLTFCYDVLCALENKDYTALSSYISKNGVRFTPYSTVDPVSDLILTSSQISSAALNMESYVWGVEDGSGDPIRMTISDYMAKYVYDAAYTLAPRIGINQIVQSGNAKENVAEVYPDDQFVEFNFPGLDPEAEGLDWCSIKLVVSSEEGGLKLVGLIHSEWTI